MEESVAMSCSLVGVWKLKRSSPLLPESASLAEMTMTVVPMAASSLTEAWYGSCENSALLSLVSCTATVSCGGGGGGPHSTGTTHTYMYVHVCRCVYIPVQWRRV